MVARALKTYSSGEYHYVFGEVYAPLQVDTDGEAMTAGDVRKMAHDFIAAGMVQAIDRDHDHVVCGAEVVESFIARENDPEYRKGAWVLGVRMKDGATWEAVKSGAINGFSVDALVHKSVQTVLVELTRIASGTTESSLGGEDVPPHSHVFYAEFLDSGRVKFGTTDDVLGHVHPISGTVVTDTAMGHSHRYFVE